MPDTYFDALISQHEELLSRGSKARQMEVDKLRRERKKSAPRSTEFDRAMAAKRLGHALGPVPLDLSEMERRIRSIEGR